MEERGPDAPRVPEPAQPHGQDAPGERDAGGTPDSTALLRWVAGAALGLAVLALILLGEKVPPPLARGSSAPAFDLPVLGETGRLSLADHRGRVVLLNFWATWCKPCEDEMPAMERLYRSLGSEPFEVLAVSVDEDLAELASFRERLGLSFPILMDPRQQVTRRYQTTGFPESLLIDRSGRVAERYVGPRDWDAAPYRARIRRLLLTPQ